MVVEAKTRSISRHPPMTIRLAMYRKLLYKPPVPAFPAIDGPRHQRVRQHREDREPEPRDDIAEIHEAGCFLARAATPLASPVAQIGKPLVAPKVPRSYRLRANF